jgi:UDP-2,3-diacylglucosamine pyrophosphatase LpxH
MTLDTVIVSDLHYGDKRCNLNDVAQLFGHIGPVKRLIVAGDILDSWVASSWDLKPLNALLNGLRPDNITLIAGNHDPSDLKALLPSYEILNETSVETCRGPYRVIHGHQYDHLLQEYSVLARIGAWLQQLILKKTGWDIQRLVRFSVSARNKTDYFKRMVGNIIQVMDKECQENGEHGVICGHTHYPVRVRRDDAFDYINSGDLLENLSYVRIDDGGEISLCSYFPTDLLPA